MKPATEGNSQAARKAVLLAESAALRQRLQSSMRDVHDSFTRVRRISSVVRAGGLLALSTVPLVGFLFGSKRRSLATVAGKAGFVWQLLRRFLPIVSSLNAVGTTTRGGANAVQSSASAEPGARTR